MNKLVLDSNAKNFYDIHKDGTPTFRASLMVIGAILLIGACSFWAAYGTHQFSFDPTRTASDFRLEGNVFDFSSSGAWEWIGSVTTTYIVTCAIITMTLLATKAGCEHFSYPYKISPEEIRKIRNGDYNLREVRNLLCKDLPSGQRVYRRNVNLGPHVRTEGLNSEELSRLDAAIEAYNSKLEKIDCIEKQIEQAKPQLIILRQEIEAMERDWQANRIHIFTGGELLQRNP